ncbi:MAG: F0F1 ATP synthase subunit epsilon [Clostridiales bacterium GWE2_32_10]|nr:MAG: F0F1 ATP synthase subunit epsilon [Clostridiales bacterium GWE2_32_10]
MSEKRLKLQISTPDKDFYDGDADMVIVNSVTGEMGILPKHLPLVTILDIGIIRIKNGNDEKRVSIDSGFMEIKNSEISILTDSAEWPEDIDLGRAEKARQRAEERINAKKDTHTDFLRAEMSLKRAINRIRNAKG